MFRHTIPSFVFPVFPSLTWQIKTDAPKLYLTFDDGPHPHITNWVMNELSAFNAKATFFCVGDNVRKYPDVYRQILLQGHAVGNHTYHHVKGWSMPTSDYVNEVNECAGLVNSNLFRPPYGRINLSQIKALKKNYHIIMWTLLTRDYDKRLNVPDTLRIISKSLKPGCIIVMHDSEKAENNLKALLPEILRMGADKGYTFEAIRL